MSGRSLARTLDVSESLIRRLKVLAAASPEERRRARLGEIRHAEQRACVESAEEGASQVLQWFYDEKMAPCRKRRRQPTSESQKSFTGVILQFLPAPTTSTLLSGSPAGLPVGTASATA
jgi:hypothetical protein